ncbi:hypothetical protein CFC21_006949 [Triticum aestivum]|uniref:Knottin scorpion toxin-like domain-containing protein n=2 Tax=Triticum aestivum TaxID=4565 RepID=A0A3B5YXE5_WHEAT|nr:hypothetical protein CFC21_006949 [Triticum aestivum]
MATFKMNLGPLFLAALMVLATIVSPCHANNEIHADAVRVPASCYPMKFPKCTEKACYKYCINPGGHCKDVDYCCCPID